MQTERTYKQDNVEPMILSGLRVEKLDANPGAETIEQLAQIYRSAWSTAGIDLGIDKVRSKIKSFDLSETFVVRDGIGNIYASIHTLPVKADNLVQLAKRYKFYNTIEEDSKKAKRGNKVNNPNYRICFSITVVEGVKVKNEENQIESLAGFLLRRLPAGERKVAFSRFADVQGKSREELIEYYKAGRQSKFRMKGPVWMHEGLGAVTFAILPNARVKDRNGAGAIIMIVYPNNDEEKKEFEKILVNRSKGIFSYQRDKKLIFFDDLPEGI